MAGGALLGGIGSIIGGTKEAEAARDAANIQAQAAREGSDRLYNMYQQQRQMVEPWRQAGMGSLSQLQNLMGFRSPAPVKPEMPQRDQFANYADYDNAMIDHKANMQQYDRAVKEYGTKQQDPSFGSFTRPQTVGGVSAADAYQKYGAPISIGGMDPSAAYSKYAQPLDVDVTQDPGYQFRLQEGQKALEQSAAAKGGFFSGQTGKDLMKFGQGLASQEYGSAYDRAARDRQFGLGAYGQAYGQQMAGQQMGLSSYAQAYNQQAAERNRIANTLASLSGAGQQAAGQAGQWGGQAARGMGQYGMAGAQAQGQGLMGQAEAQAGTLQDLTRLGMDTIGGFGKLYGMGQSSDWGRRNQMINDLDQYGKLAY
jgi:hypothetical protein